jgi:hypothetical protein
MADSIAINEVKIPKGAINTKDISVITIPKLSVGHSESLGVKLFTICGLVSIYYSNRFYCFPTKAGQKDLISVLSERLRDFSEIKEEKVAFSCLDEQVKERLLIELFKYAAAKAYYFDIYDRTFFEANENIDPFLTPSFEITVSEFEDSYGYFINPRYLSLANCTRLSDKLQDGDRLIRLCAKRFECSIFLENGRCKYSYPSYIGFLSNYISRDSESFDSESESLKQLYDECPGIEDDDFWILYVKRTKDTRIEHVYPSFLASRELTVEEQHLFNIYKEFKKKQLPPPFARYRYTKTIINNIFRNDSMIINELIFPVTIKLENFHELHKESIKDNVIVLEEPLLQFDPIKDELCSIEPSSLFFKGVYDSSSANRSFSKIKPYVILPTNTSGEINQLFDWLANKKTYINHEGKEKFEFVGLNHRFSKFNCEFIFPEEEDLFYADTEESFLESAETIVNQWNNDNERIVLIVLPESIYEEGEEGVKYGGYAEPFSLYYQLKKIFVENGIPCQMIEKGTFSRVDRYILQSLLVNIYSKLGGRPWSLHSPLSDVNAFIGIGFGLNPKETNNHVYIGVANVFDKHGEWLGIYSDHKDITNEERESFYGYEAFTEKSASYKLSEDMAQKITEESLKRFRDTNPQIGYPRNLVLHKNGRLYDCEIKGIMEALRKLEQNGASFEKIGLVSIIQYHNYRLYGNEDSFERGKRVMKDRPPKRGAVYFLKENEALLCTTGKFYGERPGGKKLIYSGIGTPRPLLLINHEVIPGNYGLPELQFYPFIELIKQVFGLSKIHWGSLRTDIHLPVTSLYSSRVAKVISKSGIEKIHRPAAKRPWFL